MALLRLWTLLCSVLFLAVSPAQAESVIPDPPECLPASVLAALEGAGLLPTEEGEDGDVGAGGGSQGGGGNDGMQGSDGGATGPDQGDGSGHDSGDGDPDAPWWTNIPTDLPEDFEAPFYWIYYWSNGYGPPPPACEDLPPPPVSFLFIEITDPEEDPFHTVHETQSLAGEIISGNGSPLQEIQFFNQRNLDWGLVDVSGEAFDVEGIELEIGENPIVVFGSNVAGASDSDTITVIRKDKHCNTHQGNVLCTEPWCDGSLPMSLIKPQYRTWLEQHPSGIGVLYPMHGDFPPATDLPPPPADPLDAELTYSVFQENGQPMIRFHAELRSFDSLPTPFTLGEVAVEVTASGENGDTTMLLTPFCYDDAEAFYDLNGEVFGYVDAILPYDGTTTVTATLVEVDDEGEPIVPTVTLGTDRNTFIPNDNPIATTDPVPNGLVAQINDTGLDAVAGAFSGQVSTLIKDGLADTVGVPLPQFSFETTFEELEVTSVGLALSETSALNTTLALNGLKGHLKVNIPILGDCHIWFETDSATVAASFTQLPASDAHQIDLAPAGTTLSFSTPTYEYSDSILFPGCGPVMLYLGQSMDEIVDDIITGILEGVDKELEPGLENEINGLGLGSMVGDLLQVKFDGTFSSIDDLTAIARYNVDAHFEAISDNVLVTESFAPPDDFMPFGTTAPGVGGFDLGVYLTPAALNQVLAARTNDGMLSGQITELTPGQPLTVDLLNTFGVFFPDDAQKTDPVVVELVPTMAPMTDGGPGPDGDMYQLDIWQLILKVLWTDGQGEEVEVLRAAVDFSLGFDIGFPEPWAPPATELSPPTAPAVVKVLFAPYGVNDFIFPIAVSGVLATSFDALVGGLFGDGNGGPIGVLGLDVEGEGALRAGDAMALLFDLSIAPTQANLVYEQDDIEDISVEFTVTFPFDGVSFAWDFGDGDTQTTSGPSVTHIYGGLPGYNGLPPGLHDFGVKVDVTRENGAVVSGNTAILICIKENPDDVCEQ